MIVIKTETQYKKELKAAYDKGYVAGISDHELDPKTALELIETFARGYAHKNPKVEMDKINKAIDIVKHNYKIVPKEEE